MSRISRREFVALMGAGVVASSFPFFALSQPPARKLGIALLGLGNYSENQLAPALQNTRYCELRGLVTGSPEKIPRWQSRYPDIPDKNVYSYDDMHRLADNPDIDVVYIVVPTGLHKKYAVAAANAGKHVWCEKPMAMNTQECQEIISACNKNKVKLSIGYRMQHEPNTRQLAALQNTMPYGDFTGIESFAGYAGNGLPADNWRMQKEMGGGALYDMGVYAVNGARFISGREPIAVTGRHEKTHPKIFKEVDETTFFTMEFADGFSADCGTSVVKGFNHLKVDCEQGWYQLKPMQSYTGVKGYTSDGQELPAIDGKQQTLQMDNDALAIINDKPVLVPGEEGMKDVRIIEAIFEAAKTGKSVSIKS